LEVVGAEVRGSGGLGLELEVIRLEEGLGC